MQQCRRCLYVDQMFLQGQVRNTCRGADGDGGDFSDRTGWWGLRHIRQRQITNYRKWSKRWVRPHVCDTVLSCIDLNGRPSSPIVRKIKRVKLLGMQISTVGNSYQNCRDHISKLQGIRIKSVGNRDQNYRELGSKLYARDQNCSELG
jgi:hypothetical protein